MVGKTSSARRVMQGAGLAALLVIGSATANAGGFAVREQSAEFQGMSFAGHGAAGGGLSGMFWNPAVAAYAPAGIYSESHYSAIFGRVEMTGDSFLGGANLGLARESGNIADPAVVPASYMSLRLSDRWVAAISINSPFGLTTEASNRAWAGQTFARTSEIKTYNFAPTLAYKLSDSIAVAVGIQMERIEGRLKSASGITPASRNLVVHGDDFAFGFTAGVNFRPTESTNIGLGYRSAIQHTLDGGISIPGSPVGPANSGASMNADVDMPDIVTLSLRQVLSPQFTLLGSVEWTNWSRVQRLDIVCEKNAGPNLVFCPAGNGQLVRSLELGWHDSWFMSVGGEYKMSPALTLRSGLAYEISPIQNPDERSLRVPDTDRIWASIGATYKWNEAMSFDFAYSHIFGVGDDKIDRTEGGLRFIGNVDAQVDIVSASLKVKLGGAERHYEEGLK